MNKRESTMRGNSARMDAAALSDDELDLVSGGAGGGLTCSECGGKLYPLQPLTSRDTHGEYQCQKCKKIFYL